VSDAWIFSCMSILGVLIFIAITLNRIEDMLRKYGERKRP
jgi:hypothetical protein